MFTATGERHSTAMHASCPPNPAYLTVLAAAAGVHVLLFLTVAMTCCWLPVCMLQDVTRTGTYHAAITENRADFEGKAVMDVGAGSGILSLFAAQVGGWEATTHALARGRQANHNATNGGSSSSRVSQRPQLQAGLLLQPQPPWFVTVSHAGWGAQGVCSGGLGNGQLCPAAGGAQHQHRQGSAGGRPDCMLGAHPAGALGVSLLVAVAAAEAGRGCLP